MYTDCHITLGIEHLKHRRLPTHERSLVSSSSFFFSCVPFLAQLAGERALHSRKRKPAGGPSSGPPNGGSNSYTSVVQGAWYGGEGGGELSLRIRPSPLLSAGVVCRLRFKSHAITRRYHRQLAEPTFLLRVSLEGSSTGRGFSRRAEQARRLLSQCWIQQCRPCGGCRRPVPLSFLVA